MLHHVVYQIHATDFYNTKAKIQLQQNKPKQNLTFHSTTEIWQEDSIGSRAAKKPYE